MPLDSKSFYRDVIHSMTRRMWNHDYASKCIYFLTLRKQTYIPPLSIISGRPYKNFPASSSFSALTSGEASIPSSAQADYVCPRYLIPEEDLAFGPQVNITPVGKIVAEEAGKLPTRFPVKILSMVVMPDHVHILLRVTDHFPRKLGAILSSFKGRCSSHYWASYPESECGRNRFPFWEKNYNDRPLYAAGQLNRFYQYIKENPRRYLIRKLLPDFFYRRWEIIIKGHHCHAVGNIFLLNYPGRMQVRFSRRYSTAEWAESKEALSKAARHGEVLVSTLIHPEERSITKSCIEEGARLIWVRSEGFPERGMVKGSLMHDLAVAGRLLIIGGTEWHSGRTVLTRAECMRLNDIAAAIVGEDLAGMVRTIDTAPLR